MDPNPSGRTNRTMPTSAGEITSELSQDGVTGDSRPLLTAFEAWVRYSTGMDGPGFFGLPPPPGYNSRTTAPSAGGIEAHSTTGDTAQTFSPVLRPPYHGWGPRDTIQSPTGLRSRHLPSDSAPPLSHGHLPSSEGGAIAVKSEGTPSSGKFAATNTFNTASGPMPTTSAQRSKRSPECHRLWNSDASSNEVQELRALVEAQDSSLTTLRADLDAIQAREIQRDDKQAALEGRVANCEAFMNTFIVTDPGSPVQDAGQSSFQLKYGGVPLDRAKLDGMALDGFSGDQVRPSYQQSTHTTP